MTAGELYDAAGEALACLEGNHPDGAFVDAHEVAADILRDALQRFTREEKAAGREVRRPLQQQALDL